MPQTLVNVSNAKPGPFNLFVDSQSDRYNDNLQTHEYTREEGLIVLPTAGPVGSLPRVIRIHAPYGYRQHDFAVSKRGAAPVLPKMEDTPSGDTFLGAQLTFSVPAVGGANNQLDFFASGTYMWVQGCSKNEDGKTPGVRGTEPTDVYQTGVRPFNTDLLWTSMLAAVGLLGGPAITFGSMQKQASSLSQADIATNPNYLYLTDNFVGNFFSADIVN